MTQHLPINSDPSYNQTLSPAVTAVLVTAPTPRIQWDHDGLRTDITYTYASDGSVDWKALIPRQYLIVKRENEATVMKSQGVISADQIDLSKVNDAHLQVLLGGWKKLLAYRGYTSLTNPCTFVTPEKAVATCTITFAPNYETRMQPVVYSWTASASLHNTSGDIPQMFLEATACNRALSLCLRGFLNIGIVGKDEMGPAARRGSVDTKLLAGGDIAPMEPLNAESIEPPKAGYQPKDTLSKKCLEVGITFEKLKEGASTRYRAEMQSDPTTWASIDDVPSLDAWTLIDKLSKAKPVATPARKG